MKILNVLVTESASTAYRDISDEEAITLMRVVAGKTTSDTARERELAVMDRLVDLGLLHGLSYAPTQQGQIVANMALKRGPRDARMVQQRNAKAGVTPAPFDKGRSYTNVGDRGEDLESEVIAPVDGDQLRSGSIMGKARANRDNSI